MRASCVPVPELSSENARCRLAELHVAPGCRTAKPARNATARSQCPASRRVNTMFAPARASSTKAGEHLRCRPKPAMITARSRGGARDEYGEVLFLHTSGDLTRAITRRSSPETESAAEQTVYIVLYAARRGSAGEREPFTRARQTQLSLRARTQGSILAGARRSLQVRLPSPSPCGRWPMPERCSRRSRRRYPKSSHDESAA